VLVRFPQSRVICVSCCLVIGLADVLAQWMIERVVRDAFFVGMLLGATVLLFSGIRIIYAFILRLIRRRPAEQIHG
jgi:hypothetical protein